MCGIITPMADANLDGQTETLAKLKDEFVALAAHELRGPLAVISWSIELISKEDIARLSPMGQEKIKNIFESNKQMISLVNDLLDVAHIDEGKVPYEPALAEVVSVILKVVETEEPIAAEKEVKITFNPEVSELTMMLDVKRFTAVMANLLENAVKYNRPGGVANVTCKREGDRLLVSVADNGIGIPLDEQELVWKKFNRASNAIKTGARGTGLGLYMVRAYIVGWGGKVELESRENEGTTVRLELPIQGQA